MTAAPFEQIELPLTVEIDARALAGSKDAKIVNGFVEKDQNGWVNVFKRPGTARLYDPSPGLIGMGSSNELFGLLSVSNAQLYANNTFIGGIPGANSVFACDFAGYPAGVFIRASAGTQFYTVTAGPVITPQTNGSLSTKAFVSGVWLLDGTMYMLSSDGFIFGSNINDPTVWPVTNAISVGGAFSDFAMALAKQKVYLVSFKSRSLNVFYDAGNPTGSPLSPVPGGFADIGCYDARSMQVIGDDILWVGVSSNGLLSVYQMTNLQVKKVSNGAVERIIYDGIQGLGRSCQVTTPGHRFYLLHLPPLALSLCYDLETGEWAQWQTAAGGAINQINSLACTFANNPFVQQLLNSEIWQYGDSFYTDFDGQFTLTIQTPNFDAGTKMKKFLKTMDFVGDQVTNSTLAVSYSENDYQTFSTPRTVDLSVQRPYLMNCGTFRKRAYKFVHSSNTAFRMTSPRLLIQRGNL